MDHIRALSRHRRSFLYPWLVGMWLMRVSLACCAISHRALLDDVAMRPSGSNAMAVTDSPYLADFAVTPADAAKPGVDLARPPCAQELRKVTSRRHNCTLPGKCAQTSSQASLESPLGCLSNKSAQYLSRSICAPRSRSASANETSTCLCGRRRDMPV